MRIYLDVCCLKRPFDDQSQPRIAVETAAIIATLVAAERGEHDLLRSAAHYSENAADPDPERCAAMAEWLAAGPPPQAATDAVRTRFRQCRAAGLGQMDALHLAWAVELQADVLLTTDDRFAARASRLKDTVPVRVVNPAAFAQEPRS